MSRYASMVNVAALVALAALTVTLSPAPAEAKGPPASRGKDRTPPVVYCPANITKAASGPLGIVVTFSASATDDTDSLPKVTASPASGSLFAVGTTIVTVTATDKSGNSASCTFDVRVLPYDDDPTDSPFAGSYSLMRKYGGDACGDVYLVWSITISPDGTISATAQQTALPVSASLQEWAIPVGESWADSWTDWYGTIPMPSGLTGGGVMNGFVADGGRLSVYESSNNWFGGFGSVYVAEWGHTYDSCGPIWDPPAPPSYVYSSSVAGPMDLDVTLDPAGNLVNSSGQVLWYRQ